VCCGTKRLTEIRCPDNCGYLTSAREHPAAVVQRQRALDMAVIGPAIATLSGRQLDLLLLLLSIVVQHRPDGFAPLVDQDVAEAAGALASTLETSARGVIYEHAPGSANARSLMAQLRQPLTELAKSGGSTFERFAVPVLRSIEEGVRQSAAQGETGYLQIAARLVQEASAGVPDERSAQAQAKSALILP
jgi:hypothetical protein